MTAADLVFDKQRPSAFHGTALDSWLKQRGVQTLLVTGMKTQYCIDTTCRAAADLGYSVVLVSDAHTCMDTQTLAATQIIAHHNTTLAGPFVQLMSSDEVCEALTHPFSPDNSGLKMQEGGISLPSLALRPVYWRAGACWHSA